MSQFANQTSVPVRRSKDEIMAVIEKYGCDGMSMHQTSDAWGIDFYAHGRKVRFMIKHPSEDDPKYKTSHSGRRQRNTGGRKAAWEQDLRQIYRALLLIIKAKLEYVESGHAIFEHEFMANIIDPVSGKMMGDMVTPMIAERYEGRDTRPTLFLPGPND